LRDGDETDALAIECLHNLRKFGKRAGQPVNLVDNNGIDLARSNIFQQLLKSWANHVAAGEATIVVLG
jgi:hypothetical protein